MRPVGAVLLTLPSIRTPAPGGGPDQHPDRRPGLEDHRRHDGRHDRDRIGTGSARKCGLFSQSAPLPQRVTITSDMTLSNLQGHSYGTFEATGPAVTAT